MRPNNTLGCTQLSEEQQQEHETSLILVSAKACVVSRHRKTIGSCMKSISEARSGNVMPVVVKITITNRQAIPGKTCRRGHSGCTPNETANRTFAQLIDGRRGLNKNPKDFDRARFYVGILNNVGISYALRRAKKCESGDQGCTVVVMSSGLPI